MKTIAKTTKPINLIDPVTKELVEEAPHLLVWTQFLEARTGAGQIEILAAGLPEEATDVEFQKYLKDSDGKEDLAVAAFVEAYKVEEEAEEEAPVHDRSELEKEANALEIKFRKDISDEKLAEKIAAEVAARVAED